MSLTCRGRQPGAAATEERMATHLPPAKQGRTVSEELPADLVCPYSMGVAALCPIGGGGSYAVHVVVVECAEQHEACQRHLAAHG